MSPIIIYLCKNFINNFKDAQNSMTTLYLSLALYAEICAHAANHAEAEICGLIGGRWKPFDRTAIGSECVLIPNVATNPKVTFLMDARAQVEGMMRFGKTGLETVGIYHSHPHGMNYPSETDIQECHYPDVVYLILCPARFAQWSAEMPPTALGYTMGAWRIKNDEVSVVRLVVTE
jgi:proteasome lid subunit RPN8/RPN11